MLLDLSWRAATSAPPVDTEEWERDVLARLYVDGRVFVRGGGEEARWTISDLGRLALRVAAPFPEPARE